MSLARMAEPATTPRYERHRPEQTLLYQLVQTHYPEFCAQLDAQGRRLPAYVRQEFEDFLLCGRLEHGFLRVRCEDCKHERLVAFSCKRRGFCPSCGARRMAESAALLVDEVLPAVPIRQWVLSFPYQLRLLLAQQPDMMGKVLEIVYRTLATHLIRKAGFNKHSAQTGAVTLIQRFGSALNLNLHFHMLFLDGVYAEDQYGAMRFHRVKAPTREELGALVHQLSQRVSRYLEKKGWLQRDMENTYLLLDGDDDALLQFQGYSVTYRIAFGPQAGRKVLSLQSIPPAPAKESDRVAKQAGFSLHAGVMADSQQKELRERLCRYISRPAVSEKRLALTSQGKVRYELKTPYRDGTTHVFFEPLDFIARLAALVPKPRVNLTRFHGLFAPNNKHRALVTPGKRGKGRKPTEVECTQEKTIEERRNAMTWMQRLKRVFNIDIEQCEHCGGHVKVVACIEDPAVIEKILQHLALKESPSLARVNDARGPPDQSVLFQC
ncbi:MAG: IS91 family transposase [Hahellaceae bacterium]|uniref:transposase n=1 Tax=Thiothrix sp. UBA2332 TaxID=1947696 RepID=UPI0025F23DA8|nr:IS91 family transposase [Thiothrix sp. UBA2332]MCP5170281.1 IS91 family transposase [Hahellaceae bacterium]